MKVHIYKLIDPVTNQIRYVGQAVNIKKRLDHHIQVSKIKTNTRHISNWIRSLNTKPIIEIIEICNNTICNEREKYWIKYYKNLGYDLCNHSNGGEGPGIGNKNCLGRVLSEETKQKLRESNKQKRKTLHIVSKKEFSSLREACKELNISYINEFHKMKRGTSKIFLYIS